MSIFIKAGLWFEKQIGHKGELNLTKLITDLVPASPVTTSVIETDGIFNGEAISFPVIQGAPIQNSTGIVTFMPIILNVYSFEDSVFNNASQISFIKLSDVEVDTLNINLHLTESCVITANNLTTVSSGLSINGNISSINFISLKKVYTITINDSKLSIFNLVNLISVASLSIINNTLLNSITLPSLTNITSNVTISYNNLLSSVNLNFLSIGNSLNIENNPLLTSVNFSSLVKIENNSGTLMILDNISLTSVSFPLLTHANTFIVSGNPITSISFPLLTNVTSVNLSNSALTQVSIDYVLNKFANLLTFGAGCYLTLNGGTNAVPSEAGLLNVAILEGRGVTVRHNV